MGQIIWRVALILSMVLGTSFLQQTLCPAPDGRDGDPGVPGRPGIPGQKGDRGEPGFPGKRTGIKASKGDNGDRGEPGEPGRVGYKGPLGPAGPPGEPGLRGLKGVVADIMAQKRPAFSAAIDSNTPNKVSGGILLFKKIITNQEDVYNANSGKFTCTEPGFYYFTFQVASSGDLCLSIKKRDKNGVESKVGFCDSNAMGQLQVNSGGTVLELAKNDEVWLATGSKGSRLYEGSEADSVFSGFLLFPQ